MTKDFIILYLFLKEKFIFLFSYQKLTNINFCHLIIFMDNEYIFVPFFFTYIYFLNILILINKLL